MKVYSGFHPKVSKDRIYNYKIYRTRRIVKNVFDIMSLGFQVLRKLTLLEPEKAGFVIMTVTYLYNLLRRQPQLASTYTFSRTFDYEGNRQLIEDSWRIQEILTSSCQNSP